MAQHSEKLQETKIWETYNEKLPEKDTKRKMWIEGEYQIAVAFLKEIPKTFPNYTLHDERHILNVLDAMGGLLGSQVKNLSACECELLILAAALHDVGMVYTDEAKESAGNNRNYVDRYISERAPQLAGTTYQSWSDDRKQDYLRYLHPFRLGEILHDDRWKMADCPSGIIPLDVLIAVCQAHGENEDYLKNNTKLSDLSFHDVSPRFCALLLRLGDILDFDDSRAPEILFPFAERNVKSAEEHKKHHSSEGFKFPDNPCDEALLFAANCEDPNIEFELRRYLDWSDEELRIANRIKYFCSKDWQRRFPFPRAIERKEIQSSNYESTPFCVTMDQEQILSLFTGENLYASRDVFVRELLQNAIDATLLRAKLDPRFDAESEAAAIYLWHGFDDQGRFVFRIDDHGTGMTRNMLHRYFLKVGKSYYRSDELQRDLTRCGCKEPYIGINEFGIGFLSCFLSGSSAEVSTLYFDKTKIQEEGAETGFHVPGYGLHVTIPSLQDHYAIHNQAKGHRIPKPLTRPKGIDCNQIDNLESNGYRTEPGTSVVVVLDMGKLGAVNLEDSVRKVLCAPRMPVYYNGERIGRSYKEVMEEAHKLAGTKEYELCKQDQARFDEKYPDLKGRYPKISVTVTPLDQKEYTLLDGLSGVVINYELINKYVKQYQKQNVSVNKLFRNNTIKIYVDDWQYMNLGHASKQFAFQVDEAIPALAKLTGNPQCGETASITFQSINIGNTGTGLGVSNQLSEVLFYLETAQKPAQDVGRTKIISLPLQISVAMAAIAKYTDCQPFLMKSDSYRMHHGGFPLRYDSLEDWRTLRDSQMGKWIFKNILERDINNLIAVPSFISTDGMPGTSWFKDDGPLGDFFWSYLQDKYNLVMHLSDDGGLTKDIHIEGERSTQDSTLMHRYDLFPPMPFCRADTENPQFLCEKNYVQRRILIENHTFCNWLLDNASALNSCMESTFQELIRNLKEGEPEEIIQTVDFIRSQLPLLRYEGIARIPNPPELTDNDFGSNW